MTELKTDVPWFFKFSNVKKNTFSFSTSSNTHITIFFLTLQKWSEVLLNKN